MQGRNQRSSPAHRMPHRISEWDAPLIAGIGWVSELIEIAGGRDCFADRSQEPRAKGRIIADPNEVVRRARDIIGSWCGKRFRPEQVKMRPGWEAIPAVRDGEVHEINRRTSSSPVPPP